MEDGLPDLSKIGSRDKLKPRADKEPYWQRLQAGWYVGYRPSKLGSHGTWFARAYDEDLRKYRRKALGRFGSLTGNDVLAAAKIYKALCDTSGADMPAKMDVRCL